MSKKAPFVEIYSIPTCPWCIKAKSLLKEKGLKFTDYDVSIDDDFYDDMRRRSGRKTVPQVFINGHHIGGHDDLVTLNSRNGLTY